MSGVRAIAGWSEPPYGFREAPPRKNLDKIPLLTVQCGMTFFFIHAFTPKQCQLAEKSEYLLPDLF